MPGDNHGGDHRDDHRDGLQREKGCIRPQFWRFHFMTVALWRLRTDTSVTEEMEMENRGQVSDNSCTL